MSERYTIVDGGLGWGIYRDGQEMPLVEVAAALTAADALRAEITKLGRFNWQAPRTEYGAGYREGFEAAVTKMREAITPLTPGAGTAEAGDE